MVASGRRLVSALLAPSILIALCLLADAFGWWNAVTLGHSTYDQFADLLQVTASAQCLTEDSNRDLYERTCDPAGRPYNYPLVWAQALSWLGVGVTKTWGMGIGLILVFGIAVAAIAYRVLPKKLHKSTFTAFVFSVLAPPTFLLLERGNIDALIFSVLVIAALSVLSKHPIAAGVGFGVATVLKIFPIPSALALGRLPSGKRRAVLVLSFFLALGIFLLLPSYRFLVSGTPQPLEGGFGAPLTFRVVWGIFELPGISYGPRIFGAISLVSLALLYLYLIRRHKVRHRSNGFAALPNEINDTNSAATLILIGLGSFLGAYVLGTNFDYRLVFLIFLNLGIAALGPQCNRYCVGLSWLVVGLMWCSYAAPIRLQQVADVIWFFLAPALLLLFVSVGRRSLTATPATPGEPLCED